MPKDNYKQEQQRYETISNRSVSRATGAVAGSAESTSIRNYHDWRWHKTSGRQHDWADYDCGIEKQTFDLKCTSCKNAVSAGSEYVLAVEYDNSDDEIKGYGRFKYMFHICESCWETDTGKRLSRQRFGRKGPGEKAGD